MKKLSPIILTLFALAACKPKNELWVDAGSMESDCGIVRLDSIFYGSGKTIDELRAMYPMFFAANLSDSLLLARRNDGNLREMAEETFEKFKNTGGIKKELDDIFRHVKYYYPDFTTPDVYFFISDWQFNQPVSYDDSNNAIYIALNLYLGYGSGFYDGIYDYWRQRMSAEFMTVDVACALASYFVPFNAGDTNLIELMVYNGKVLYLAKAFMPEASEELVFHYTKEQLAWAKANESNIWSYFISREMLHKSDRSFGPRFFDPAPFTKFYLELDNQSPPQLGSWLGHQIVKAYMKNNGNFTLREMLPSDNAALFQNAKYKPGR